MAIWDKVEKMSDVGAFPTPEEGNRYIIITDWELDESDPTNPKYVVKATDLDNKAKMWLSYWLEGKSSGAVKATLTTLRKAIFGDGILEPVEDIKGAVVGAEVRINDKGYTRVYTFFPAPQEIVESFSEMSDQFWAGRKE